MRPPQSAFNGVYNACELSVANNPGSVKNSTLLRFRDYYPPPPYSHLLTRPPELQKSPLMPLITAMADIDPPAVGVYQVVFQAVHPVNNRHRNVQILLDLEYNIKLQTGTTPGLRYAQQSPSGDLKQMAWEVENKAHNDKPFFSTAVRIGVARAGEKAEILLKALSTFVGLFQHGGRPLAYLTEREYAGQITSTALGKLFSEARTHRPGFLVISWSSPVLCIFRRLLGSKSKGSCPWTS